MKREPTSQILRQRAFTLIELLVVIAIMGILAALLIPATGAIRDKMKKARAQAELAQVETAIDSYKAKRGFYPPDNPGNPLVNQLYFELAGTVLSLTNGVWMYQTLDGNARIPQTSLPAAFGPKVNGFLNSSRGGGGDEGTIARSFLKGLRPNQIGELAGGAAAGSRVLVLLASVPPPPGIVFVPGNPGLNPWRYVSSNPTNNPNTYDLWADIIIRGKTNRISNWSQESRVIP